MKNTFKTFEQFNMNEDTNPQFGVEVLSDGDGDMYYDEAKNTMTYKFNNVEDAIDMGHTTTPILTIDLSDIYQLVHSQGLNPENAEPLVTEDYVRLFTYLIWNTEQPELEWTDESRYNDDHLGGFIEILKEKGWTEENEDDDEEAFSDED